LVKERSDSGRVDMSVLRRICREAHRLGEGEQFSDNKPFLAQAKMSYQLLAGHRLDEPGLLLHVALMMQVAETFARKELLEGLNHKYCNLPVFIYIPVPF